MLEQLFIAAISGLFVFIATFSVSIYMKKSVKREFKDEIIAFLESEDAPKLLSAFGAYFGQGLFRQAGAANPMKGNINIFGMKIPKVIAFGAAQKMGWLPSNMLGDGAAVGVASPANSPPNFKKFEK